MNPIAQELEAKIAAIKAQHLAAAEQEIETYKLSFEVDGAKKDLVTKLKSEAKELESKHKSEAKALEAQQKIVIKEFEKKYNTVYDSPTLISRDASNVTDAYFMLTSIKCDEVELMKDKNGNPKYTLNADNLIVGTKGEPIKSTIHLSPSPAGKKRTLAVNAFQTHMIKRKQK
jgi:hypothetical protein